MTSYSSIIALSECGKVYMGNINIDEGGEAELESTTTLMNLLTPEENVS